MRIFDFGDFAITCISKSGITEQPEDLYHVREELANFFNLICLRSTDKKIFFGIVKKKKIPKNLVCTSMMSHFCDVDFVSFNSNVVPLLFINIFDDSDIRIGDDEILISDASELLKKVDTLYKQFETCTNTHLSYFRYKLECLMLSALKMKPGRFHLIKGFEKIPGGRTVVVKDIENPP